MAKRQPGAVETGIRSIAHSAQAADIAAQGLHSEQLRTLTPRQLAPLIGELRKGEAAIRKLRQRLEALQSGLDRVCAREDCTRPVAGRADARYCGPDCRLRAHRSRKAPAA
ncbi:hypothetical protein [Pseudonocardia nigra]|uniref:hypothetical protein n=1 Tax=Pseudonocardia nigra TaxID=1921578 RepID=UPI001C5F0CF3|nr:hypothetical protein [Pseudonocardia nigra]